ncbi:MAG TPA: mismatch-specific DNA-glycosylase [Solirubrobacterales bacterium]|nr:mismatch-specific DNA-glycosylase [Solirubrobacterales bacterium]
MGQTEDSPRRRPRVTAYFAEPDEQAGPLLTALGHVVLAAASLENGLRLELAQVLFAAHATKDGIEGKTLGDQVEELQHLTAGQLLHRLREQGLPEDLEQRIDDAITRRNRLVHHLFEDPQFVRAVTQGGETDEAIGQLAQLALDCAALSVELQTFALQKIEGLTGSSKEQLVEGLLSLDPAQIQAQGERERLEAIQGLGLAAHQATASWGLDEGHRVRIKWQEECVETLADLLRPGLRAICVGINPSPISVDAGHYYQGSIGRRFWQRLRQAGLIEAAGTGHEDVAAFISGVGFTDIVKRPTARSNEIPAAEFAYGRELLGERLRSCRPALLVFTFKKAATTLFGPFEGHGYRRELNFAGIPVFVMPGPYERSDRVLLALSQLREMLENDGSAA